MSFVLCRESSSWQERGLHGLSKDKTKITHIGKRCSISRLDVRKGYNGKPLDKPSKAIQRSP